MNSIVTWAPPPDLSIHERERDELNEREGEQDERDIESKMKERQGARLEKLREHGKARQGGQDERDQESTMKER